MKTYTNSASRLQNRTAQSFQNQLHRIDFQKRFYNRGLSTAGVLDLLYYEAPRLWELAEVVGKWVWIEFNEQPPRHITAKLAELGFHWNRRRQLWQHPCGQFVAATAVTRAKNITPIFRQTRKPLERSTPHETKQTPLADSAA
jgi:hypothetical protein